jgi:DNA-binding response OmpR family regulator
MTSRLLVADDSITIQKIVSMAFETEDVEVEGIGNGQEAFDRISEFNPDIVLADVDMPGLNGFELSSKIKESAETSSIKVLLLASDFEDFDEQGFKNCGADNHISKPFKSDDIVTMVKSLLDSSSGSEDSYEEPIAPAEVVEKPVEDIESASDTLSDLDASEPSLEELLASVEKLSTDGATISDEEEVLSEPLPEPDETPELEHEDEPVEPAEPLSAEDLPEQVSEPEPEPEPIEDPDPQTDSVEDDEQLLNTDDDLMDQMIQGVEDLKESVQLPSVSAEEDFSFEEEAPDSEELQEEAINYTEEPEIFAEVRQQKLDNIEDLDSTFKEILMGGGSALHKTVDESTDLSSLGGIVPEPEDLMERITPGTFSEVGKRPATPEDIKENLDQISELSDLSQDREMTSLQGNLRSENWGYDSSNDMFTQAVADEVKQLLQKSLGSSLEKEVSGLSDVILQTIREVVREVTPEIARKVIREEIEKIKKQDMF